MAVKPWYQINAYETLRLDPGADDASIRRAYRRASRDAHPDRGGSHDAQVRVNLALEILTNPVARAEHDRHWRVRRFPERSSEPTLGGSAIRDLFTGPHFATVRLSNGRHGSGLERRVRERIQRDQERVRDDMSARRRALSAEYVRRFRSAQIEGGAALAIGLILCVAARYFPGVWLLVAPLLWRGGQRLRGVTVGGVRLSIADFSATRRLDRQAAALAEESCRRDIACFDEPQRALEFLRDRVTATTSRPRDATGVRRKAMGVFFALGYSWHDGDPVAGWARFRRGEEAAIFCYKLTGNVAVGANTVDRWAALARESGDAVLYAYHPIGFSRNAHARAEKYGARLLSPVDLDLWAHSVWNSEAAGPSGEILTLLASLTQRMRHDA